MRNPALEAIFILLQRHFVNDEKLTHLPKNLIIWKNVTYPVQLSQTMCWTQKVHRMTLWVSHCRIESPWRKFQLLVDSKTTIKVFWSDLLLSLETVFELIMLNAALGKQVAPGPVGMLGMRLSGPHTQNMKAQ